MIRKYFFEVFCQIDRFYLTEQILNKFQIPDYIVVIPGKSVIDKCGIEIDNNNLGKFAKFLANQPGFEKSLYLVPQMICNKMLVIQKSIPLFSLREHPLLEDAEENAKQRKTRQRKYKEE